MAEDIILRNVITILRTIRIQKQFRELEFFCHQVAYNPVYCV
jgi:hypothetical protein